MDNNRGKRVVLLAYRIIRNLKQSYMADKLGIKIDAYQDIESGKTKRLSEEKKNIISEILGIPKENIDDDSLGFNVHNNNAEHSFSATLMNKNGESVDILKEQNSFLKEEINYLKREIELKNKLIEKLLT